MSHLLAQRDATTRPGPPPRHPSAAGQPHAQPHECRRPRSQRDVSAKGNRTGSLYLPSTTLQLLEHHRAAAASPVRGTGGRREQRPAEPIEAQIGPWPKTTGGRAEGRRHHLPHPSRPRRRRAEPSSLQKPRRRSTTSSPSRETGSPHRASTASSPLAALEEARGAATAARPAAAAEEGQGRGGSWRRRIGDAPVLPQEQHGSGDLWWSFLCSFVLLNIP